MIGQTGFTALVGLIWLSAFAFGSLVTYWFVRQGFADEGLVGDQVAFEDPSYTRQSLLIWFGFFIVLGLVIILGG